MTDRRIVQKAEIEVGRTRCLLVLRKRHAEIALLSDCERPPAKLTVGE
jgi:hypothetical protein